MIVMYFKTLTQNVENITFLAIFGPKNVPVDLSYHWY